MNTMYTALRARVVHRAADGPHAAPSAAAEKIEDLIGFHFLLGSANQGSWAAKYLGYS